MNRLLKLFLAIALGGVILSALTMPQGVATRLLAEEADEPAPPPPPPPAGEPTAKAEPSAEKPRAGEEKPPQMDLDEEPAVPLPPAAGHPSEIPAAKPADKPQTEEMEEPVLPPPPPPPGEAKPGEAKPDAAPPAAETPKPSEAPKKPGLPPIQGSKLPPDENMCVLCHTSPDAMSGENEKYYVAEDKLKRDIHARVGVVCSDCHGGNPKAADIREAPHAKEDGFRATWEEIQQSCAHCHPEPSLEMRAGVHAKAGPKDPRGHGTMLTCMDCHGHDPHLILDAKDPLSTVFVDNQVETCGHCHEKDTKTFLESVHGEALVQSGLAVTAVCADCHGAHGVFHVNDDRSTLHPTNVAKTCGKCHRYIEERIQSSVHGGQRQEAERVAPGGKAKRLPVCTDCHQGHEILRGEAMLFRLQQPNLCGNCHGELSARYRMSLHGELTELGYGPAAKCSDCHGAHDILAVSNPASRLSAENRQETCRQCHPYASGNFLNFDPHADYTDPDRNPIVYGVWVFFMTLLFGTFSVFGLHSILWFVRGLVDVFKHGRPARLKPGAPAYRRFVHFHRVAHSLLMASFLGLALTGLPLKYSHTEWAKAVARGMGGFDSTSVLHRICAIVTFALFLVYIIRLVEFYIAGRREGIPLKQLVFGPESPVPNWRDLSDFFKMLRWFFGLGPKPTFERWTYWEKFDFWGAQTDIVIIGFTGLILWFPNFFTSFLPAVTINIADVIHSTQALLATGFVFAIHFFNTHLRPDKFPVDTSVLTGLVTEEEFREERHDYYERLRAEGKLEELETRVPPRRYLWLTMAGGFVGLAFGLALLVGILVAALGH